MAAKARRGYKMEGTSDLNRDAWLLMDHQSEKSLKLARRAEDEARASGDECNLALALHIQGLCYSNQLQMEKAGRLLGDAGQRFAAIGMHSGVGIVEHALAGLNRRMGNYTAAEEHERRALHISEERKIYSLQSAAWQGLASIAFHSDDFKLALQHTHLAIAIARSAGHMGQYATSLQVQINIYNKLGLLGKALATAHSAIAILEDGGNTLHLAATTLSLGNVHKNLGMRGLAIEDYSKALRLFRQIHDAFGESSVLNEIGILMKQDGNPGEALRYFRESAALARRCDNPRLLIGALTNAGLIYLIQEQIASAQDCANECELLLRRVDDKESSTNLLLLRARIAMHSMPPPDAERMVQNSLAALEGDAKINERIDLLCDFAAKLAADGRRSKSIRVLTKAFVLAQKGPYHEKLIAIHEQLHHQYRSLDKTGEAASQLEQAYHQQQMLAARERKLLLDRKMLAQELETMEEEVIRQSGIVWQSEEQQLQRILLNRALPLTPAEIKVCQLVHANMQSKEIAAALNVSLHAINWHRQNIRHKLRLARGRSIQAALSELLADGGD